MKPVRYHINSASITLWDKGRQKIFDVTNERGLFWGKLHRCEMQSSRPIEPIRRIINQTIKDEIN